MTTASITTRPLGYADLPSVLAIERRSFPTAWSLSMFVLELSKPSGVYLAAVDGDTIAGYLVCAHYVEAWHLMNVAVDPGRRRQGVASTLLDALLERVGADANVTLEARVSNTGAMALYERYGFRSVGTRPRYYTDTGEDAIIMWRALGTPWEVE